tara:strand:- start:111 stop:464 length:354 start_codon:yes stop_codon:yes gene_type:complete
MEAVIAKTAQDVAEMLSGVDYLEANFRTLLARLLRSQKLEVCEEVVIPYVIDKIPFGHGFADIVILTPDGVILLELKTTKKDCTRQVQKYIRNWKYTPVLGGATINFVGDEAKVAFV